MGYCERADIEDRFGKVNVETWADLDSDGDSQKIQKRIDRAITVASSRIDDAFRGSRFKVPLEPLPDKELTGITDIAATLAGVWLYTSRGIDEQDEEGRPFNRLYVHDREAKRQLHRYINEHELLPAVRAIEGPRAPFVVG